MTQDNENMKTSEMGANAAPLAAPWIKQSRPLRVLNLT